MAHLKFDIVPVDEDPVCIDISAKWKINDSTFNRIVKKYGLGYYRKGAGNYHYLKKKDIEILREIFTLREKHRQEVLALEKKYKLK